MAAEVSSLAHELKTEQVAEWIERAERLVQEEQYSTAREVLLQLLKVESQHTRARQLIALDASAVQQYTTSGKQLHAVDFLLHMIPDTLVGAFANGEILQVLLIAIFNGR